MQTKELGLILLIALLAIGLVTASLPYTTSQFIDQTTDLNYEQFKLGVFDGNLIIVDGNLLSIISPNDLNSSGGSGTDTNFETAGMSLNDVNNVWGRSGNDIYNLNSDNVGIGTESPSHKLEVFDGDVGITSDSKKLYFGAVDDASISYDGTNLVINPKDIGTGYLDILGAINIPTTTATEGIIKQDGDNLIHTYGTDNFFMGVDAGNFTTSGFGKNIAVGKSALGSLTTGYSNVALGENALAATTNGIQNVGIGFQNSFANVHGNQNTHIGTNVAYKLTSGSGNVGIGYWTLRYASDGSTALTNITDSVFIGRQSKALNAFGDTNEIVIGSEAIGKGSNTVVIGNTSTTGMYLGNDNYKLYFGAVDDASITYDGTNMLINPKVVGSGKLKIDGNIILTSPDSTEWNCGVTNAGAFTCS